MCVLTGLIVCHAGQRCLTKFHWQAPAGHHIPETRHQWCSSRKKCRSQHHLPSLPRLSQNLVQCKLFNSFWTFRFCLDSLSLAVYVLSTIFELWRRCSNRRVQDKASMPVSSTPHHSMNVTINIQLWTSLWLLIPCIWVLKSYILLRFFQKLSNLCLNVLADMTKWYTVVSRMVTFPERRFPERRFPDSFFPGR